MNAIPAWTSSPATASQSLLTAKKGKEKWEEWRGMEGREMGERLREGEGRGGEGEGVKQCNFTSIGSKRFLICP